MRSCFKSGVFSLKNENQIGLVNTPHRLRLFWPKLTAELDLPCSVLNFAVYFQLLPAKNLDLAATAKYPKTCTDGSKVDVHR